MATWMTLDQVNCEDVGLHVMGYPPLCTPRRQIKTFETPGGIPAWVFSGANGYKNMTLPVTFYMDDKADEQAAVAYLMPDVREIVFGDMPEFCFTGIVDEQVDLEKLIRERKNRRFKVNFICSPVKKLTAPGTPQEFTGAGSILHPGTARSYPVITVEGEGDGVITTHMIEDFTITGLQAGKPLVIDCGAMIVTDEEGATNYSHLCSGDYPYLAPGANSISFSGGIRKLTIEPNLAWLGR